MRKNTNIPEELYASLPTIVRHELAHLDPEIEEIFWDEYLMRRKVSGMGYFWLFVFHVHYGYLREWGKQALFWLTFGGLGLWWLIDLFRIPSLVEAHNKNLSIDIMHEILRASQKPKRKVVIEEEDREDSLERDPLL